MKQNEGLDWCKVGCAFLQFLDLEKVVLQQFVSKHFCFLSWDHCNVLHLILFHKLLNPRQPKRSRRERSLIDLADSSECRTIRIVNPPKQS